MNINDNNQECQENNLWNPTETPYFQNSSKNTTYDDSGIKPQRSVKTTNNNFLIHDFDTLERELTNWCRISAAPLFINTNDGLYTYIKGWWQKADISFLADHLRDSVLLKVYYVNKKGKEIFLEITINRSKLIANALLPKLHYRDHYGDLGIVPFGQKNHLFGFTNGAYDIYTDKLIKHSPSNLLSYIAPYPLDVNAKCPKWDKYKKTVSVDKDSTHDPSLELCLYKALGYLLEPTSTEQKLIVFWGNGANGKSTVIKTMEMILGAHAVYTFDAKAFKNNTTNYENPQLIKARVAICIDADLKGFLSNSTFKSYVDSTTQHCRNPYGRPFNAVCNAKFIVSINKMPSVNDSSLAVKRRLLTIPFYYKIKDEEKKKDYENTFIDERSGIFMDMIRGRKLLGEEGFKEPDAVKEIKNTLLEYADEILTFRNEQIVENRDEKLSCTDAYNRYTEINKEANRHIQLYKNVFSQRLSQVLGHDPCKFYDKNHKQHRGWLGFSLTQQNSYT